MTPADLRARVATLTVWKKGGQRAPHKPLLLLYALAQFAQGHERLPFSEIEPRLVGLLRDFGPARKQYHASYPFWRLQNDGLWSLDGIGGLVQRASNRDPTLTSLRQTDPAGRFPPEVAALLRQHPGLIAELAETILDAHFPGAIHAEVLNAVGLDVGALGAEGGGKRERRRKRDPAFRGRVLRAYGYRCAMCGFDGRLGHTLIGVDAAHVRWHVAQGEDDVTNGLALCALHHRLLDRGVWTPTPGGLVAVAEEAHGGESFERWVLRYHGEPLASPISKAYRVAEPNAAWHVREVFKGPARSV
jgi:putative restriction endonuclease